MNNWGNSHCLNTNVTSSPCVNAMPTPEAYYSPNQSQIEAIQQSEYWYQQQQRGISPSSSGLSREDSYSPCSTPIFNVDDAHIMNPPLSSSCTSQFMPLIDPMVYSNNSNHATAVASISQPPSSYQQPMMMPLLEHETQAHHEKLLSHYNDHTSMMATTDMNTYMTYNLRSPTPPIISNMYSMNAAPMPVNSMYVSYHNNYANQQLVHTHNHATTAIHRSLATPSLPHAYGQHLVYNRYPDNVKYTQQVPSHLMTTTEAKEGNACVSSSPSVSSSYSSSSSSSNTMHGTTSTIRHKQTTNGTLNGFPCLIPECNKLFSRPYNLKSHMRTHTHERPYECTYKPCAWKFARPHDLKRHELQHTGQKPHGCRFCHRRFARSDALKRHWKVDINCAQALKQETAMNGGHEIQTRRKKAKKSSSK
ncbi:polar growth protein [Mucor velutinosus]|uniref:Polar growth protein n=1 Tax=Mucor velutinosus TaxID=708070 RepID=A0AAN7HY73_9FUNG|nr:polar growth protein [Mucor velutinosus]